MSTPGRGSSLPPHTKSAGQEYFARHRDGIAQRLDEIEGKVVVQATTVCGMPIRSVNNAKAVERCQKATGSILPRPDNRAMSDDDFSIPDFNAAASRNHQEQI